MLLKRAAMLSSSVGTQQQTQCGKQLHTSINHSSHCRLGFSMAVQLKPGCAAALAAAASKSLSGL
jgi:hypothetical protein